MKWITRERPKIDRIVCPWFIKNFVDIEEEFIYVPKDEVFIKAKELQVIPHDAEMLPGMYVKAMIETRTENVPALPVEAIVESEGKDYIFIQIDTGQNRPTFKLIPVVKGIGQEGYVAITLPDNFNINSSKIFIKGAYALLSAMKNVEE